MANRQVWWYAKAGEKYGPMTGRELKALAAAGGLSPNDKVWKVGLPRWVDASVVRGLLPPGSATPAQGAPTAGQAAPRSAPPPARPAQEAPPTHPPAPHEVHDSVHSALPEPIRHKGVEQVMESKTGTPWSPSRIAAGVTSRASTISLGVPEDLLRAFVGPAYDRFYRSRWHAPLPTTHVSLRRLLGNLNWSAAVFTLFWLAYRKIYPQLLIVLLLVLPPTFLLEWAVAPGSSLLLYPLASLIFLLKGNDWYFAHARRRIRRITDLGLPADITQKKLAVAGGTSWFPGVTAFFGVVLIMLVAGMVLGLGPALLMRL